MSLEIRKQIIKVIRNKNVKNIAIVVHNSPDGDCIGSAVALEEALKTLNKKVDIILHNKVDKKFAPIIGNNKVDKYMFPYEGKIYDLAFVLDVADYNRTYFEIQNISKMIVIIDHHLNNDIPHVDYYLNENDASTGITVYKIIKFLTPITESIATAIYLTIRSDTNNFKNSNTTSKTHMFAAELLDYGANLQIINEIYDNKTLSYLKLLNNTLGNVKIDYKNKIAYLIISKNDIVISNSNMKEASMVMELIKNIENIDVTYLFIENNNQVIIKSRSKQTDVSHVMKQFGGGGHKFSAGCIIISDDIYRVKDKVIEYTNKTNGK